MKDCANVFVDFSMTAVGTARLPTNSGPEKTEAAAAVGIGAWTFRMRAEGGGVDGFNLAVIGGDVSPGRHQTALCRAEGSGELCHAV